MLEERWVILFFRMSMTRIQTVIIGLKVNGKLPSRMNETRLSKRFLAIHYNVLDMRLIGNPADARFDDALVAFRRGMRKRREQRIDP